MQKESEHPTDTLSALVDGELDAESTQRACQHWRDDGQARARWHAYHLIGDVLRSDALATAAEHDERFLHRLRDRLTAEPAVLAPEPLESIAPARRASTRWAWLAPAAVAAGFMAVASVLVVTQVTPVTPGGDGVVLAKVAPERRAIMATAAPQAGGQMVAAGSIVEPQTLVADGNLMRDARLDRYLTAHMEFGGSSALGAPSGFLRAATTRTPDR